MAYPSTASAEFLSTARAWIRQDGEVLALIRYSASAGSRDYELHPSPNAFASRLQSLPSRTCVTLLRGRHLPLRGTVDPAFIAAALSMIEPGKEWLVVSLHKTVAGSCSWFPHASGETVDELREALGDYAGRRLPWACTPTGSKTTTSSSPPSCLITTGPSSRASTSSPPWPPTRSLT